ncbi:PREDICTED: uncharacterized protein LOC109169419 [Ipomoea nil]|uniref:uncharacterized protein LOC109169419 n=1 Tax=Ipomoea nil TaxID=35883 RepID=UPI000901D968|nr:PREDICTED: uncharacterized protein LOC109169419 [Ipomoea nil]
MISLIWNCQGAASKDFCRTLKHFVRIHNPSIVCLLEPKVSGAHANSICASFGFPEWIRVEAIGFSGGIWVLWKNNVTLDIIQTHPQFLAVQVNEVGLEPWALSFVYGSPNLQLRRKLFAELSCRNLNLQGPWLSVGDYNSVTCQGEVSNPDTFNHSRYVDFSEWIFREGLLDLGYTGAPFTLMRGVNSSTFRGARLDRALANIEWRLRFPEAQVQHLSMVASDHSPLLVNTCISASSHLNHRMRFKFNAAWTTHPKFQDFIGQMWSTTGELESEKKSVAEALQAWNRNVFGNIFQRKNRTLARLKGVQRCLCTKVTPNLLRLERKLREELENTLYQEELLWYQRSREEWIRGTGIPAFTTQPLWLRTATGKFPN